MKWPNSWWVEQPSAAPSAKWAAEVEALGKAAKYISWSKGVLAGPPWLRRVMGDNRKPLFEPKEAP